MRVLTAALLTTSTIAAVTMRAQDTTIVGDAPDRFAMRVLATGLESPWELAWGPDRRLWVTERQGKRVVRVNPADGARTTALTIADVHQSVSQDGLLGLAFHPGFLQGKGTDFAFVAFTYDAAPGADLLRRLAIRRYTFDSAGGTLGQPMDVITALPAHNDHVGGRLAIGPDLKLYLTIGDQGSNFGQNRCNVNEAQRLPTAAEVRAKDWTAYQGKILRVDLDGGIPSDNPVIDGVRSHVFSWGHRNPLGLAFGPGGRLYETEHGPSSDDEVNLIEGGRNYGWPHVAGRRDDKAYVFANWSASAPQPCASLARDNTDAIPASVPSQKETAWSDPRFHDPLRTFFTVETGYDLRRIGSATIAPGGVDVYVASGAIPGWRNSLLVLSLIRGAVYRLALSADGRSVEEPPIETFRSANRYRDVALNPDGRTIYFATDATGPYRDRAGEVSQSLANPGSILEFTYSGDTR